MEGNGIINSSIVITKEKRKTITTKKQPIHGKINTKQFGQRKSSVRLTSYLNLLAIPTTTPSFFKES